MNLRTLVLGAIFAALAAPAFAVVKVYNATPPGGTPGDRLDYGLACPPVQVQPGTLSGHASIDDTGGGSATLTDIKIQQSVIISLPDLATAFGPGAFIFANAQSFAFSTTLPTPGTGSTAPGGSVSWGVISGWDQTGFGFCISSPQTICTAGSMLTHGQTDVIGPIQSPTYDLGTWSFDAVGDMSASSYIYQTLAGGVANSHNLLRGTYVGASIPALPLIGAAALSLGLLVAGSRALLRKK